MSFVAWICLCVCVCITTQTQAKSKTAQKMLLIHFKPHFFTRGYKTAAGATTTTITMTTTTTPNRGYILWIGVCRGWEGQGEAYQQQHPTKYRTNPNLYLPQFVPSKLNELTVYHENYNGKKSLILWNFMLNAIENKFQFVNSSKVIRVSNQE